MYLLEFHLLFVAFMATAAIANGYVNDWDQPFDFKCPPDQALQYVSSVHDNYYEDRRWEFQCGMVGLTENCTNSGYVNEFNKPVFFYCPGNKVMVGIHSYHNNTNEDRRFGFHCCNAAEWRTWDCQPTDYINEWDGKMKLSVPEGQVIKGAFSYHDDYFKDRRWRFTVCRLYENINL